MSIVGTGPSENKPKMGPRPVGSRAVPPGQAAVGLGLDLGGPVLGALRITECAPLSERIRLDPAGSVASALTS
jgi:hypothetical protein